MRNTEIFCLQFCSNSPTPPANWAVIPVHLSIPDPTSERLGRAVLLLELSHPRLRGRVAMRAQHPIEPQAGHGIPADTVEPEVKTGERIGAAGAPSTS
jgi:hypothetical protein